ncbi:hypothetical protein [Deinococcus pimensis]|uniref:hypothetical protein n=1 Tax=Deinococcus pimensis TaxID=309888 RepID=UPI000486B612|nr:hypothetical protein [Deinococcus pimensis]
MSDDLDILFARARAVTEVDVAAAERALHSWKATRARQRRGARAVLAGVLASAAMITGAVYLARPAELPTSAAYDVYSTVSGEGW